MTDIVESTATASRLGDMAWKQRLGEHNRLVRARLERYLGKEVNTTGDGFLAMFASALGAIRCAASIREATDGLGLPVRIGIHTGEVELSVGHRRSWSHPTPGALWRMVVSASSRGVRSTSRASRLRSRSSRSSTERSSRLPRAGSTSRTVMSPSRE
jgi:hypothetical protein